MSLAPTVTATREVLYRPDGRMWSAPLVADRRVTCVPEPDVGMTVLVTRTHDLERAARMCSVRWAAHHGTAPMPEGEREWRRWRIPKWPGADGGKTSRIEVATGVEPVSFPVCVFRLAPVVSS